MLRQYYWRCDLYFVSKRSAANNKKSAKTSKCRCEFSALRLLALQKHFASSLSPECNKAPITFLYGANTVGAMSLIVLHLFFQNLPKNWAVLTGNGNM
jgi:hypothetical protein